MTQYTVHLSIGKTVFSIKELAGMVYAETGLSMIVDFQQFF